MHKGDICACISTYSISKTQISLKVSTECSHTHSTLSRKLNCDPYRLNMPLLSIKLEFKFISFLRQNYKQVLFYGTLLLQWITHSLVPNLLLCCTSWNITIHFCKANHTVHYCTIRNYCSSYLVNTLIEECL